MSRWLESFAYRTAISWWIFALTVFLSFVVALATIGYQSYKAATTNPVNTLRSE
jgi:putative ABC transport system permease protein